MAKLEDISCMTEGSYALNAIRDALIRDTAADLKTRVMAIIEPEIDDACKRAAASLEPKISAYREHSMMRDVLQIIVTQRSPQCSS